MPINLVRMNIILIFLPEKVNFTVTDAGRDGPGENFKFKSVSLHCLGPDKGVQMSHKTCLSHWAGCAWVGYEATAITQQRFPLLYSIPTWVKLSTAGFYLQHEETNQV